MVDDFMTRSIEAGRKVPFGHCHSHGIGKALPQGAGCCFHARGMPEFRMTGGFTSPLSEIHDIIEAYVIARKMKHAVKEHGSVAGGKYKAISVKPAGIFRVVLHYLGPENIGCRRKTHGCAGMPGIGLLNSIHGKSADCIDTNLINCCPAFRQTFIHNSFLLF